MSNPGQTSAPTPGAVGSGAAKLPDWPVFALGFRIFFLLAAAGGVVFGLAWPFFWSFGYGGAAAWPVGWHAHEMIFGFAAAVIAGFLLTATQNWAGRRGVHGTRLAVLAAVWTGARVLAVVPGAAVAAGILSLAFAPLLAWYLVPYVSPKDQRENRGVLGIAALLFTGDLLCQLQFWGYAAATARQGWLLGLYAVLAAVSLIGGRVIPFFTENAVKGAKLTWFLPLELLAHATIILTAATEIWGGWAFMTPWAAAAAAAVHGARWLGWRSWQARRLPILWVLHLGYLWLVAGFLLRALADALALPPGVWVHAFAIGCVGVMIHGMMTRVALGHTGRPIRASRAAVAGYLLLNVAGLVRVGVQALAPAQLAFAVHAVALLWAAAFGLYLWQYIPILTRPRLDGRPG